MPQRQPRRIRRNQKQELAFRERTIMALKTEKIWLDGELVRW